MTTARTQAERVIDAFGGVPQLWDALRRAGGPARSKKQIYCWTYPTWRGGTGGTVPHWMLEPIREAAKCAGLKATRMELLERALK